MRVRFAAPDGAPVIRDVSAPVVRDGRRGRGVGSGLYEAPLEVLAAQGFYVAAAVIELPNPTSVEG